MPCRTMWANLRPAFVYFCRRPTVDQQDTAPTTAFEHSERLRRRVRAMTSRGVAARSRAEHPAVFAAELGRTVVAHLVGDSGDVVGLRHQQQPRLLEPYLLLELDRALRGHDLKVPVKRRQSLVSSRRSREA